jgi:predicted phage-related endonuclease
MPYLTATPDGLQWCPDRGLGSLELKCCWSKSSYDWGHGEWGPPYYVCQVQHQMLVTGLTWGSLAGMVDGKFCFFDYGVDAEQHKEIVTVGDQFWAKVEAALAKAA